MAAPDWLTARPIAHRGYHDATVGRIENTLPAAEAAIAHRFAIECDLQRTADDEVVVFHDDTLDRLTDLNGPIETKTLAELRGARFKEGDATIPTLSDLLDLVDGRVPLIIELKSRFTGDRRLEAATATILSGYSGAAAVMSFDPASMIAMRRLAPNLPRGMLGDGFACRGLADDPPPRPDCQCHVCNGAGGHAGIHLPRRARPALVRPVGAPPFLPPAADYLDGANAGGSGYRGSVGRPDHLRGIRPGRDLETRAPHALA